MNTPTGNSDNKGEQSEQSARKNRYKHMPMSWRRDREELAERISDLIAWRREVNFSVETDEEMVVGILNLIEAQRMRNLRLYQKMIKEAVKRGESKEKAAVEILHAFIRNAANEVQDIESMAEDRDEERDEDTPT